MPAANETTPPITNGARGDTTSANQPSTGAPIGVPPRKQSM